jgi:putative glutathione S-transferase
MIVKKRTLLFCWLLFAPATKAFVIQPSRVPCSKLGLDKGFNLLENASRIVPQGQIVNTAKESWKFIWKRMMAELAPQDKTGSYRRPAYTFGGANMENERGRYHLYVGNPCPWCHRAQLALALRGISREEIGMTRLVDNPVKASRGGWIFSEPDADYKCRDLRELYDRLSPGYKGRCTAPLLVDKKTNTIVSNESSDIVRMLNDFGDAGSNNDRIDLYPPHLKETIDETNEWIYTLLNNGVYQCGFSTTQSAYDEASGKVRQGLERCEQVLSTQPYLCGSSFTEADLRLLPTVLRYDGVYAPLFRAGGAHLRIKDYPSLHAWLKRCWEIERVPETIDLADANVSYYKQLFPLNPGGILPTRVTAASLGLE